LQQKRKVFIFLSLTGTPKGAILTHDALVFEINSINAALQCYEEGKEIVVSYLPLAHMSGQLQELFMGIRTGAVVYFADRNAFKGTLINTLKDARPTNFGSVPRLYEKFYERLSQVLSETKGIKRTLVDWARRVTLQYHLERLSGRNPSTLQYEIAKKLVLNKVKEGLGFDRSKNFFVGASPISLDITHFFMSLDIPLQECYGMTENSGIAFIRARWHNQLQSVGKILPGLEAKILDPDEKGVGEICTRGRSTFAGYINDLEKTKETIDSDKWLRTGDLGYFDEEGYLFVTGRIKELIITAGGENIPFLHIENLVKRECLAISNAFLIGDKRKFLSMLITLKTEVDANNAPLDDLAPDSLKLMKSLNLSATKLSEAHNHPKVIEAIQAAINRANENAIANFQKVQKFAILPAEFSIGSGEFSPTMKLKRNFVHEKYKNIIDELYK
jgi:long-chain-fatty-acid--CoA ligase ACSBG